MEDDFLLIISADWTYVTISRDYRLSGRAITSDYRSWFYPIQWTWSPNLRFYTLKRESEIVRTEIAFSKKGFSEKKKKKK